MGFNLDDYEDVATRIDKFWADHPTGRIDTTIVRANEGEWVLRAEAYRQEDASFPAATGYAQEVVTTGPKQVNTHSALENCETSAIGRALANMGYATKGRRASRQEMEKVQRFQGRAGLASQEQQSRIVHEYARLNIQDASEKLTLASKIIGREVTDPRTLTAGEASTLLTHLQASPNRDAVSTPNPGSTGTVIVDDQEVPASA